MAKDAQCTRRETEYGFALFVEESDEWCVVELYGITGFGRYELVVACNYPNNKDSMDDDLHCLEEDVDLEIYIRTKEALNRVWEQS